MPDPSSHTVHPIVTAARAVARAPVVIAIDGRSGSGKTTLAAQLLQVLPDSVVIHLDDIYPGWDGLATTPPLVAELLRQLRAGEPASYRRFDWARGEFGDVVQVPRAHYVIVEGAGSSVGIARPYADVRVWLEAGAAERKRRALDRDGATYAPHWQRWADQEDAVFAADRTPQHAHLVLRTD
ncbi:hypothetical protein [Flexivirga sp. B27]